MSNDIERPTQWFAIIDSDPMYEHPVIVHREAMADYLYGYTMGNSHDIVVRPATPREIESPPGGPFHKVP